jgi:hypothetical protein
MLLFYICISLCLPLTPSLKVPGKIANVMIVDEDACTPGVPIFIRKLLRFNQAVPSSRSAIILTIIKQLLNEVE